MMKTELPSFRAIGTKTVSDLGLRKTALCNEKVAGSIPAGGSMSLAALLRRIGMGSGRATAPMR